MTQLVVLTSLAVLLLAPVVLVTSLVKVLLRRAGLRTLVSPLAFHAAAFLTGWVTWRTLKPDDWGLSFRATFLAGMNSKVYGHLVEHAAELLAAWVVFLATAGGLFVAGCAWWMSSRAPKLPAINWRYESS